MTKIQTCPDWPDVGLAQGAGRKSCPCHLHLTTDPGWFVSWERGWMASGSYHSPSYLQLLAVFGIEVQAMWSSSLSLSPSLSSLLHQHLPAVLSIISFLVVIAICLGVSSIIYVICESWFHLPNKLPDANKDWTMICGEGWRHWR